MSDTPRAPYRIWNTVAPFRKSGSPIVGNLGSSLQSVVIMTHATFKRLIAENPNLADAQFEIGDV